MLRRSVAFIASGIIDCEHRKNRKSKITSWLATMKTALTHDIEIRYSRELVPLLRRNSLMLCLCSRQDRRLLTLTVTAEELEIELCTLPGPGLLAFAGNTAAVAVENQIQLFRLDAQPWCDRPRERAWWWLFPNRSRFLGALGAADMDLTDADLWLQSEADGGVVQMPLTEPMRPFWHPQDCSETTGGEWQGCGLALDQSRPAYAALSRLRTRTPQCHLIDLSVNRRLPVSLTQFHSPRLHMGELWLLDTVRPGICSVNRQTGATAAHHGIAGIPTAATFQGTSGFVASQAEDDETGTLQPRISVLDLRTGLASGHLQFVRGLSRIDSLAWTADTSGVRLTGGGLRAAWT